MKELIKIQSELKAPKNQRNNFGKYNYRSCEDILEAVKPLAHSNNCVVLLSDNIIDVGGRIYVQATATLSNGKESTAVTALAREPLSQKGMNEAQITGSASSYARKYALNGLFAIDDTKDSDTDEHKKQEAKPSTPVKDKLTKEGLNYLITKGTKADIDKAVEQRECSELQIKALKLALKEITNGN